MKTLVYLLLVLCLAITSCKKHWGDAPLPLMPGPMNFVIIGKDGHNIIHSLKDSLFVNYVINGVTETVRLTIYKVQVSATDTTSVSQFNGFVVSDKNYNITGVGYISDGSLEGVRNFNLYLKGIGIGTIYLDFRRYLSSNAGQPSSTFTFNGVPVKTADLSGVYSDGSRITSFNGLSGKDVNVVYLLQM